MQRIGVFVAFVLVAAGLSGSAGESVAVAQAPPRAAAVLAIVDQSARPRLAWLDPASLRPLARRSLFLSYGAWSPVFSPAGRSLALGGGGPEGVRIVELAKMAVTARIARRSAFRGLRPLAWPEPRRLLVLDYSRQANGPPERLLVLDPVARKIVGQTALRSSGEQWIAWAPAGNQLVALIARGTEMARLVLYGPQGDLLRTTDLDVPAGSRPESGDEPSARYASPGLAIDPAGRRAFVVDAERIAEIDLDTLDVSYVPLADAPSILARVLAWLEPTAQAKLISGFSRHASWLGDDRLAIAGSSYDRGHATPAGLELVDTGTGKARMLEPRAFAHHVSQGLLFAFGADRNEETNVPSGVGLAAFAADGTRLWSTLGDEAVWLVEAAGGYAYVPTPEEVFPQGVRVLDLATGAVLRTVRGEMPTFVVRD